MADITTNKFETPEAVSKEQQDVARTAMIKELWEKMKVYSERMKGNEKVVESVKEFEITLGRMGALLVLCLLETNPATELIGDVPEWAAVVSKLSKNIPEVKKFFNRFVPDLYPNVPDWLLPILSGVDSLTPGIPVVGMGSEVYQLVADLVVNMPKSLSVMSKESFRAIKEIFFNKSEYADQQIKEAQLAFVKEGGD